MPRAIEKQLAERAVALGRGGDGAALPVSEDRYVGTTAI